MERLRNYHQLPGRLGGPWIVSFNPDGTIQRIELREQWIALRIRRCAYMNC